MHQFEYKFISHAFSPRKVLRDVQAHEQQGWSLYSISPTYLFLAGSGGSTSLHAIVRREIKPDDNSPRGPAM